MDCLSTQLNAALECFHALMIMPSRTFITRTLLPSVLKTTVEPLNKGHYEAKDFVPCREVVPISEVK